MHACISYAKLKLRQQGTLRKYQKNHPGTRSTRTQAKHTRQQPANTPREEDQPQEESLGSIQGHPILRSLNPSLKQGENKENSSPRSEEEEKRLFQV